MITPIALDALPDAELRQRIGAALLDASPDLPGLEAERQRRLTATAHTRLADAEAQRRQIAADAAERDALLAALTRQLADLEQQHRDDLALLDATPQGQAYTIVERAYRSGRAAYSLSHDLHGLTGDRRFYRPYRVPDALALHGGAVGEAFMRSIAGRPPRLETPWRPDVERLRELWPHVERIANGG